jgi:hypothetical protein
MSNNVKVWLHGIAGAFLGALGNGISNLLVDPQAYNLYTLAGLRKLALSSLISAAVAVGLYLKSSPVPQLSIEKTSTETNPSGSTVESSSKTIVS